MTRAGIEKPRLRVQRTAGQKQPRGLFLGRGRFRAGGKLMWPGWLAWARVAGVGTAAYGSVRAGHARPLPGWLKESSRQQAGIPPALRRHLPLTREARSGGASIHPCAVRTVENGNRKSQPRAGGKLMWPGWLVGARVAGVGTAACGSVRAGHARLLRGGGRVSGYWPGGAGGIYAAPTD